MRLGYNCGKLARSTEIKSRHQFFVLYEVDRILQVTSTGVRFVVDQLPCGQSSNQWLVRTLKQYCWQFWRK